jgi:protocatechuate 3,4-dioxygenase beta subunit
MVSAKGHAPLTVRGIEVPSAGEVRIEVGEEAALEGTVTDATGAPRAGATVMVQRIPVFMRFATTGADGRYRVGGLGAGAYLFYVMEPGASFNLRSESVTLEEGKTTRKDHRLGEGTKVTGRVTRGGKPVGGVMVMLMPAARSGGPMGMLTGGGGGGFSMGAAREDGTYLIEGVAPGRYAVTVQTATGGSPGGGATLEVARGATEVTHDVALPEASITGTVVDEEGKPVTGAAITALAAGTSTARVTDLGSTIQGMGGQAFSDDAGGFRIADMAPGTFRLRVQADGRGTEIVEDVSSTAGTPVRVVLRRGSEIAVRVVGPDGNGVRGAALFLEDASGREITNLSNFDAVRTNDQGRATLRAPDGEVKVEAAAKGFAPGSERVSLPAGGEVTIRLARGSTVKVRVVGAAGTPVAGAGVEVLDADGAAFGQRFTMEGISDLLAGAATSADGTWTRGELPAGTWKVRAVAPDGRSAEDRASVGEGETVEVVLRLP